MRLPSHHPARVPSHASPHISAARPTSAAARGRHPPRPLPPRAAPRDVAPTSAPSPPADIAEQLQAARDALAAAVAAEDYAEAARLRDEVAALEARDPVTIATHALQAAIAAEAWEEAAAARDALAALAPPPPPPYVPPPTASTATTRGVTVAVKSFFVAAQSAPGASLYTFAYRIVISLAADAAGAVQLLTRHWHIEDGGGRVDEVRGPGVVGEQPVLQPGETYAYSSFCQLTTPAGSMQGSYGFVEVAPDGAHGASFDVAIARFGLDVDDDEPPGGKF